MSDERKPLTDAQQAHLDALAQAQQMAAQAVQQFLAYLRAEHDAPAADGWNIATADEGFVRSAEDNEDA